MQCEKCNEGQMKPTKVYRLSGCLVAIGYTLSIPAVLILVVVTLMTVIGGSGAAEAGAEAKKEAKQEAVQELQETEGVPQSVVADFKDDGAVEEQALADLSPRSKGTVESTISAYEASVAGADVGAGVATGMGITVVVILYFLLVPTLIVGFLLTLKKKVMKCSYCGYIYERA